MSRGLGKAERLQEMERLYFQRAYSDIEMAERLEVDRTTVFRDRTELETKVPFTEVEKGRWKIDRSRYLSEIRVNLNEALVLYLSARRASQQTRISQPHTASALEKLALVLRQPMTDRLVRAADKILSQNAQPERVKVLETITRSWVEGIKVRIVYQGLHASKARSFVVSPYLIEPSPWSDGTYLIGHSDVHGEIATFKVERIESAALTTETFTIPEEFNEQTLLQHAWGIWAEEGEPETVTLRFGPGTAARRLRESIWHPSQIITELVDGGCLWTAKVAEWREMLPWVRGWGADCEVVGPERLREELAREARRMGRLYNIEVVGSIPPYFYLWAKTEISQSTTHPLVYHMLDVGECTLALWKYALSEQTKQTFARALNLDVEATGQVLAFWASLHDLGKAAPGFQRKYTESLLKLREIGFVFPKEVPNPAPHGILSAWALKELLPLETGLTPRHAKQIAFALGGHHGAWPTNDRVQPPALQTSDKGDGLWNTARAELLLVMKEVYQPANAICLPTELDERNTFLTLFSGLVSVADWIGSMAENFPFVEDYLPARKYISEYASRQARSALEKLGWLGWQADGNLLTFAAMFPDIEKPNPIQQKALEATIGYDLPALVIIEAPTGIGKTEAALCLADTWLQTQEGRGLYIAMPTQATSNQMFERVAKFLQSRYRDDVLNLHLVHGAALLANSDYTPQLQGVGQEGNSIESNVKAETWFLPRKRTLLAPFGVGTVDQALMSVLQTNHFFVRLFGLGQKVVVFDEVHAYDTYMSTLFQRLLQWLRSIGTSVILLSATLPDKTRKEFAGAWLGNDDLILPPAQYPRLTIASGETVDVVPLPAPESHTLQLDWVDPSPEQIAHHLSEKLESGGCAAVVCNRVKRAQEVYQAVEAMGIVNGENLILFHARFPFYWRKEIEDRVLSLFSKTGERPHKAIVVATQVIEQSLDLDFDYMLTDLAPVDLMLQRAGRLHRHSKNDPNRPDRVKQPVLAIARPAEKNGLPEFGQDARIYDADTLLCTWLNLNGRERLSLPDETSGLIEAVYGETTQTGELSTAFIETLREAKVKARLKRDREVYQAKQRLIAPSYDEDLLTNRNERLEEDDARVNADFRALTRLSEPNISIICLYETAQGIALEPDGTGSPVDIQKRPDFERTRELLMRAVNVQRKDVVDYILAHLKLSGEWKKSAAVGDHYPIVFDLNGEYHPEGANFILQLTRELGLQVIQLKEEK